MTLRQLIREWRDRLLRCHRRAVDSDERDQWLWRIRERLLTFLVERYTAISDHPVPRACSATTRDDLGWEPLEEFQPRQAGLLRDLLLDVKLVNERARQRLRSWRWWV